MMKYLIDWRAYDVKFVEVVLHDNEACYGVIQQSDQSIKIAVTQPGSQQREALLHEILHAIEVHYRLDFKEGEIHLLSVGLMQLFAEKNKPIREWLCNSKSL